MHVRQMGGWCSRLTVKQAVQHSYHVVKIQKMVSQMANIQIGFHSTSIQERPYQHESTASRLLSEVKHVRARLVLRWGTTLESRVLFFCFNGHSLWLNSSVLSLVQIFRLLEPLRVLYGRGSLSTENTLLCMIGEYNSSLCVEV